MAFTSSGYKGTVNAAQFAALVPKAGACEYGVDGPDDFEVTAVAGQDRVVSVAGGRAWGHSVLDFSDVNETKALDLVTTGSRWDLVVLRRTWQPTGGITSVEVVAGGSSNTALPSRNNTPGSVDDQPLALVRVDAESTAIGAIIDLRVWARNGGALAKNELVKQYLTAVATLVEIDGIWWRRVLGDNDVPDWKAVLYTADAEPAIFRSLVLAGSMNLAHGKYMTLWNLRAHTSDRAGGVSFYGGVGTIEKAGLYEMDGQVTFDGGEGGLRAVNFLINGQHHHRTFGQGVGVSSLSVRGHFFHYLTPGDTVAFQAYQSTGKNMVLSGSGDVTRWTLRRVSR